uniref:Uncharacterized protein n=1 Tax=Pithovirus LCPAC403 TaxID=2506596 RepID=A0A481ZB09_9VIRU|nr:MAG: hypothetical protein LCPAC403_01010 [Pithovirus LCPAC403]
MGSVTTYIIASVDPNYGGLDFEVIIGEEKLREYAIRYTLKNYFDTDPYLEELKTMKIHDIISNGHENGSFSVIKVTGNDFKIKECFP